MTGLEPRRGGPPSRRAREKRAYQLVVGSATATGIAVVGFVLAAMGVIGFGLPFVATVVALICLVMFRRMIKPAGR